MSNLKLTNNAISRLVAGISTSATSLSVTPGDGVKFPTITGSEFFPATLIRASDAAVEIVKVTARSIDTFTIVRAQEATAALTMAASDRIELRLTAGTFTDEVSRLDTADSTNASAAAAAVAAAASAASAASTAATNADAKAESRMLHGQCRLTKSGSNLVLSPFNGNKIVINGAQQTIPSAGVSLAPTGLLATTLYYIYAYMNSGTMTLEASTTGHSADSTTGVEIKTGDVTRSLVGMAYCKTAATFADTVVQRFVLSWFNQRRIPGQSAFTTSRLGGASGSYAEINSEIRVEFITWGSNAVDISLTGAAQGSSANFNNTYTRIAVDGAVVDGFAKFSSSSTFQTNGGIAVNYSGVLSEGYHYATLFGKNDGATDSAWVGGASSATDRCVNNVLISG